MSHDMSKPKKMSVRPAKTQISLSIHPVWSESSLCAQWVAKDPSFLHADSEDSDQTESMPRLIRVFAGRIAILLVLSCRSSYGGLLRLRISDACRTCQFVGFPQLSLFLSFFAQEVYFGDFPEIWITSMLFIFSSPEPKAHKVSL